MVAANAAARALGKIGRAAAIAIEPLSESLHREAISLTAGEALAGIGPAAVPALRQALRESMDSISVVAARALGRIGAPASAAIPDLVDALHRPLVELAAIKATGGSNSPAGLLREFDIRLAAVEALGRIGGAAIPALIEALSHPTVLIASSAAQWLGRQGTAATDAVPLLSRLLTSKDAGKVELRSAAVEALGSIGTAALPVLVQMLEHDSISVRASATRAIGLMGAAAAPAVPPVAAMLHDVGVRQTASRALVAIGPAAIPVLVRLLQAGDAGVRVETTGVLGEIRPVTEETIALLADSLTDSSYRVRIAAAGSLGRIGFAANRAEAKLLALRKDKHPEVRQAVAAALNAIRNPGQGE